MKFSVERRSFLSAVATASRAVSPRSSLAVLANVLLQASASGLQVTGSNLERWVTARTSARVNVEGETTVSAARLEALLREFPQDWVEVEMADKEVRFASGSASARLLTLDAAQFPAPPVVEGAVEMQVPCADLGRAIRRVVPAASVDTARYVLCGVHMVGGDDRLVLVATDGARCASEALEVAGCPRIAGTVVATVLAEAAKQFPAEGEARLAVGGNMMRLDVGDVTTISRLIDGQFPSWQKVFPAAKDTDRVLCCPRLALVSALKRALAVLVGDSLRVLFRGGADGLVVSAQGEEGMTEDEIAISRWEGEPLYWAINAKYLLTALEGLEDDEVAMVIPEMDTWAAAGVIVVREGGYAHVIARMLTDKEMKKMRGEEEE